MAWPRMAVHWTPAETALDVERASVDFRSRRLGEPLGRYLAAFDAALPHHAALIGRITALLESSDPQSWGELWSTDAGRTAFRYLGADNADVVIRLDDGRLLAIECKGSNSAINSRKRLNKEAAQNARAWLGRFGDQVVPAVALQGVFKDRYVLEAQDTPMVVFWSHRLEDVQRLMEQAR